MKMSKYGESVNEREVERRSLTVLCMYLGADLRVDGGMEAQIVCIFCAIQIQFIAILLYRYRFPKGVYRFSSQMWLWG